MSEKNSPQTRIFEIVNQRGLHARASAKFVALVGAYTSTVSVGKDGTSVNGLSIMGLMMLAASPGCSIEVTAEGEDAEEFLDAAQALIADKFGEEI
ncbi:HPr family phosphocarrier protein [Limoniibacter endophyticus]|uniref:Phosphocarrier protein HPr n=1 Tax=Limoniibacter endophyticus TaxID=1565040 RepID=A0A8J3GIX6_9HYPH|nr:HPr family phosphocarrier protein [Limoniibacter endophyticus]GHC74556.1 phosphocarrier protein HPr [Limoniibacter endophyticus]